MAVTSDLASVGLADRGGLESPEDIILSFSFRGFSFSFSGEAMQSLIPPTTRSVSLREKSGPREVLTGPKGAEMTGLGVLRCMAKRVAALDGPEFRSQEAVVDLTSRLAGLASMVARC